jgi:hypothetical protein
MSKTERPTSDALALFLRDLESLAIKHRIAIGGCGCCGSPYLYSLDAIDIDGGSYRFGKYPQSDCEGEELVYMDAEARDWYEEVAARVRERAGESK